MSTPAPAVDAVLDERHPPAATQRASKKRKQPAPVTTGAIAATATPAVQAGRVVIPLRNKRLRKHAALIQTPTSGFLLCCARKRETECMQSALRLLQHCADDMYGVWVKGKAGEAGEQSRTDEDDEQEDADGEERGSVGQPVADAEKDAQTTLTKHRGRFSLVCVGRVEGLAFIACNDPLVSTTQLTLRIFTHLQSHTLPLPLSPHLSRLLPVHTTSSSTSVDHILARFHHLTPQLFPVQRLCASAAPTVPLTFAVVFRASNSKTVERSKAITALATRVEAEARKAGVSVAVRLVGADVSVLCWLVKSVAMLAVLPDYHKLSEYSVDKLSKPTSPPTEQAAAAGLQEGARTKQAAVDDAVPAAS